MVDVFFLCVHRVNVALSYFSYIFTTLEVPFHVSIKLFSQQNPNNVFFHLTLMFSEFTKGTLQKKTILQCYGNNGSTTSVHGYNHTCLAVKECQGQIIFDTTKINSVISEWGMICKEYESYNLRVDYMYFI